MSDDTTPEGTCDIIIAEVTALESLINQPRLLRGHTVGSDMKISHVNNVIISDRFQVQMI